MDRPDRSDRRRDDAAPVFVISVAAQLAGLHAQTLRQYDRLGLVSPGRSPGGGRRYSARDVSALREVARLSQEGTGLAGIKRILELEDQVAALRARVSKLQAEIAELHAGQAVADEAADRREADVRASFRRDLVPVRHETSVVVWHPARRSR